MTYDYLVSLTKSSDIVEMDKISCRLALYKGLTLPAAEKQRNIMERNRIELINRHVKNINKPDSKETRRAIKNTGEVLDRMCETVADLDLFIIECRKNGNADNLINANIEKLNAIKAKTNLVKNSSDKQMCYE